MPHLIVECSGNLADRLSPDALVRALHEAALETGVFPLGGMRTRLHLFRHYRIADGDPSHGFVHVTMRIGRGRDLAIRRRAGEHVFGALQAAVAEARRHATLALSLEIEEIDPDTSFRDNDIHDRLARRS